MTSKNLRALEALSRIAKEAAFWPPFFRSRGDFAAGGVSHIAFSGDQDYLCLRGTLVEAIRAVVGLVGSDGYLKRYYFDERLFEGILPADIWLRGKYVPAPAGWHDYRSGI